MAISKAKSVLGGALASVAAVGLTTSPSLAEEQQAAANNVPVSTQVSTTPASYGSVQLLSDATRAAFSWSKENDGLAVAVYLGTESRVTPSQIEQILTREIQSAGVRNVEFFFEQNDVPASGVAYAYAGDMDGPFHLGEARPAAAKSAQQYLFQRDRLSEMALNN